jgi:molecular chaperone GrpE (heat shock protein)
MNTTETSTPAVNEIAAKVLEQLKPMLETIVQKMVESELLPKAPHDAGETTASEAKPSQTDGDDLTAHIAQQADATLTLVQDLVGNRMGKLEAQVQDFAYKDKINKELHEELQQYQTGLRKEFVSPLLKSIIREHDRADHLHSFYFHEQEQVPQGELFGKLLKEFKVVTDCLLDVLSDYGLDPFVAKEGEPYSTKEHKLVDQREPATPEQNGTIAECVHCGFRDVESGRLMRQAEVIVYKIKN